MIALDAEMFGQIVSGCADVYAFAVRYARKYVWYLNQQSISAVDVGKHNLRFLCQPTEHELKMEANADNHYMFLSHYKVEAGTEAALMQEAFKQLIAEDLHHVANHFDVPVFLDSEN